MYGHIAHIQRTGATLSLRGAAIENNSFVNVDDIGDNNEVALLCHTDKYDCCRYPYRSGEWFYPDGSQVGAYVSYNGVTDFFYRNRDYSVVRLLHVGSPSVRGQF